MEVIGKIDPDGRRPRVHERRLKAVAVLPSLATLGNLVCGFGAIYMCMLSYGAAGTDLAVKTLGSSRMEAWFPTYIAIGCYLLFLAGFFDGLDGRLARLTRKTSEFGAQLDTLADVISFGVAPAMLTISVARPLLPVAELTEWARVLWRLDWIMVAAYVSCAALRLARFNVENVADESAHMRFKGLPSPGAAAALIGLVIVHEDIIRQSGVDWASQWLAGALPFIALGLGLLMVSRVRYIHVVNTMLRGRRPVSHLVVMTLLLLGGAVLKPQLTMAVLAVLYAASGPFVWLKARISGRGPDVAPGAHGAPANPSADRRAV